MAIIANAIVKTLAENWGGEVQSGSHSLITDKPESFGGLDRGLAPYDYLCTSLISCTMITLRMYAKHKGLELGEFTVEADFHANKEGQEWIERRLSFHKHLDNELKEKLLAVCEKTPVTKTLLRSVEIRTQMIS